jgi:hypothetical protein
VSLLGACAASHPDERATVTASIKTVIKNFNLTGYITQSSPVAVGSCSAHRAVEAWQAKLTARALQLPASDRSFQLSAVFVAHIGAAFSTTPFVRQADSYETQAAADKTGTALLFSVPGGEYVRIDGVVAC